MLRSRKRVLVVDDSAADVQVLAQALAASVDVQFALSGEAGIEQAQLDLPDLILLDLLLPDIDGYETLRRLQADPRLAAIPVIFVTAVGETEAEARGLQLGAEDYISKPFNLDIVRLRVGHLLERVALRRQLELALAGAHQGLWDWNVATGEFALGAGWAEPLGYSGADPPPLSVPWERLVHPEDQTKFHLAFDTFASRYGGFFEVETRLRNRNGQWTWTQIRGEAVERSLQGRPLRLLGTFMDINRRKRAELDLLARESDLTALIDSMPDTIVVCDELGRLERCHSAPDSLFLRPIRDVLGRHYAEVLPEEVVRRIDQAQADASDGDAATEFQVSVTDKSGQRHFDVILSRITAEKRATRRLLLVARDITPLWTAEATIQHLAFYDALTDLPNRRLLFDRLHEALDASRRSRLHGAVLFIDLDAFKAINDRYGHEAGDVLLQHTAQRLSQALRACDTVARLGGDEFVVLLRELGQDAEEARDHAAAVAGKLLVNTDADVIHSQHRLYCTLSVGVRLFDAADTSVAQLLQDADAAMYAAKQDGGGGMRFFERGIDR